MAADEMAPSLQFPAGLKILAVDDDNTVLEIIKQMCTRCSYHVTTCGDSSLALNLVRERKGFDLLLIDVHMPNMDGYDFLQRVIQEQINVPVIMMSVDGATSAVYKAIKLGACDYWVKPLREESFQNMWHHVVRKDNSNNNFGSLEEDDDGKKHGGSDGSEFVSSVVDATTSDVDVTKRSNAAEADVDESDNCHQPPTKKPRVVWSTQLHKKFVRAVTELGLDKAVPKRILELMNEPGLTRENVASHLQKYRLYLKRSEVVPPQQNNGMQLANTTTESMLDASRKFEFQALDAASNVPYETLAGLHANMMPNAEQAITYPPHPLAKCPPNIIPNNFPQSIMRDDTSTTYGARLPCSTVVVDSEGLKNHLLMDSLQQQQMIQQHHQQIRSINPCMVVAPYITQNCGFGRGSAIDYGLLSSNNSLGVSQFIGERNTARGFATPTSISRLLQNSSLTSGSIARRPCPVHETQVIPYGSICYQESPKNLGCDAKDTCIASKSAGLETILSSLGRNENVSKDIDDNRKKEEPNSMNSPKENHNLV